MKKTFAVTPLETLELVFPDGTTREACFNVESLIYLTEEFGDITRLVQTEMSKPYDLAAKILYSGMKPFDSAVTLDDARGIMVAGGVSLMAEIMDMFNHNFGTIDEEDVKKNLTPLLLKQLK